MIKIEVDSDIVRRLANAGKAVTEAIDFSRLGAKGVQLITERTDTGIDVHGNPFKEYSPAYYLEKSKTHSDMTVNLQNSNDMLSALSSSSDDDSALIYFLSSVENSKAYKHNTGTGGVPKREFFGLNESDANDLSKIATADIQRYLDAL